VSKSLEIDQDNLRMKFSALNVNFNSASFDPLGTRSPPYECIEFGYPYENARFLLYLLSTNLARERLQRDTDLLRIITSTADELCISVCYYVKRWSAVRWETNELLPKARQRNL